MGSSRTHTANISIGTKFGGLIVISKPIFSKPPNKGIISYLCECEYCKTTITKKASKLIYELPKSCGCIIHKYVHGEKFGMLTILEKVGTKKYDKSEVGLYKCICDCGNITIINTNYFTRKSNIQKNCGCRAKFTLQSNERNTREIWRVYVDSAKKRNLEFNISMDRFISLISDNCTYCGSIPKKTFSKKTKTSFSWNGIDRIDSKKGYVEDNVVTCCSTCNRMKLDHSIEYFKEHIALIYGHIIRPSNNSTR